jgi:hypothetical protein
VGATERRRVALEPWRLRRHGSPAAQIYISILVSLGCRICLARVCLCDMYTMYNMYMCMCMYMWWTLLHPTIQLIRTRHTDTAL